MWNGDGNVRCRDGNWDEDGVICILERLVMDTEFAGGDGDGGDCLSPCSYAVC